MLALLIAVAVAVAPIQGESAAERGAGVRERAVAALGGREALARIERFAYTLERTNHVTGTRSSHDYEVDFRKRRVRQIERKGKKTVVRDDRDDARLGDALYYNFVNLLLDPSLAYAYVEASEYRGEAVDVVRVTDPKGVYEPIDLYVSRETGLVVTSTSPGGTRFADESEYVEIGGGARFPLRYQVFEGDKLVAEGYFKNLTTQNRPR
jgi:hypothetical protein